MSEPTFLTFVEKIRLPLFAIVALFLCYVRLVFPALAEVVAGLGVTLSTFSQASYQVTHAFRESWVLTAVFLGIFLAVQFRTGSRGLIALSNCVLSLVLLFMMLGVALPTRL
jgi:type II secretory pathway component PulF